MNSRDEKELRVILDREFFDKLDDIKDFHGLKNLSEIVRFLITKEHREINREDA